MRKITRAAVEAFYEGRNFTLSNTSVNVVDGVSRLYLFDSNIAEYNHTTKIVQFSMAGYPTPTTLDRLRGVLSRFGLTVNHRKGKTVLRNPSTGYEQELLPSEWYWHSSN